METNLGKRQSPIRLRGISWGSLCTFFSTEFRADRWVNGGSNDEPLTRLGDEAFGDLNRVIVAQIEENDKVRSVYGGSVLRIERNGQVHAPVGLLGRIPRTECNYDSLDETN